MTPRSDLNRRRHAAIQKFLDDNVDLFGITPADDVGEGPFMLTDWLLVIHLRDLSVDVETSGDATEVRAAFFRLGMGYSQKLGMIAALDEGVRFPRVVEDDD